MSKKKTLALEETLRELVRENRREEAQKLFSTALRRRPGDGGLYAAYAKALIAAGPIAEAAPLLEEGLRHNPDSFPLLYLMGQVDENGGGNLCAFDLYVRAEAEADSASRKKAIGEALERIKTKVNCSVQIEGEQYRIVMEGNSQQLALYYDLPELNLRRALLDAILPSIDPKAKTVLEIECGTGVVGKNLAGHGFKASGVSAVEEDIMRATVFEQVEMLRMTGYPSADYTYLDLKSEAARSLDKNDVIMVLPTGADWYEQRGPEQAAALLKLLLEKARKQLYFYLPAINGEVFNAALLESLAGLSGSGNDAAQTEETKLCADIGCAGRLYRIDRRQAAGGDLSKVLPCNLEVAGSRSLIFTVEVEHCRSLNGFAYTEAGWNHFTAALFEAQQNPSLTYEESILKRFFDRFQPRNRQEHLFGADEPPLPPLDGGFTLLPWMERKNRPVNAPEAPGVRGGNHHFGPNDDSFGLQELALLKNTAAMLRAYGYRPEIFPDGYIQGYLLKDGPDYRFLVTEGQHRMAATGLLGEKTIKVRFDLNWLPIIDRAKLKKWPQVNSGLYSKEVAEKVFYYYFIEDGRRKAKELGLFD